MEEFEIENGKGSNFMNFASFILLFAQARKAKRKRALEFIPDSFEFYFLDPKKSPRSPRTGISGTVPGITSNEVKNKFPEIIRDNWGEGKRDCPEGTKKAPMRNTRENVEVLDDLSQSFKSCRGHHF